MDKRQIVLIRHPEVAAEYRGICYGQTDVPLSPAGQIRAKAIAEQLARWPVTQINRSPASRTAFTFPSGVPVIVVNDLAERHFGEWENQSWDAIYQQTGNAMDGFLTAPATFAPTGGETTFQLRDRVMRWYDQLPTEGFIVAITHGGPIAAIRGTLANIPIHEWGRLIPPVGDVIWLEGESASTLGSIP